MKGFVITLISISLIVLLVMFSTTLRAGYRSMERAIAEPQPLTYAAFLFDDVANSVNSIVGPEIRILETNSSTEIRIADTVPKNNFTTELSAYENFLESVVANETHSSINANFSNMSSGKVLIIINRNYIYENDPATQEMLFTSQNSTGATFYRVSISIDSRRANLTSFAFNESGDLNVSLNYADSNGSIIENGVVFSNKPNRFRVDYDDGSSLYIDIGIKNGNDGSLWIKSTNATADVSWSVELPPAGTKGIGYSYDATLDYVQGNIRLSRKIEG